MPQTLDREQWLLNAAEMICEDIISPYAARTAPPYRVSVGFPKGRRTSALSASFPATASESGHVEIFISPATDDPGAILVALTHELVHAYDRHQSGHRGYFADLARSIGLTVPLTTPSADAYLTRRLAEILEVVGPLPHARLDPTAGSRKGRMVKIHCPPDADGCGFIAYTSRMWVERLNAEGAACPVCDMPTVRAAAD